MRRALVAFVLFVLLCSGCETASVEVRAPDATRVTTLGEDGPYGVMRFERTVRVRVDASVDCDVLVPFEGARSLRQGAPVVVFVQGGLVSRARYRWLGTHLATRGFVVIAPGHALDLAFFEQGNALDVLATLRRASAREGDALSGVLREGPVAMIGHSLGGVVAAGAWDAAPETVSHLALLASYPQGDTLTPRTAGRALTLVGDRDGRTSLEDAARGAAALRTSGVPVTHAVIAGMSHMQFADDVTADEAANDGVPEVTTDVARARTLMLLDALLADLAGDAEGARLLDDPARWPEGVREGDAP